MKKLVRLIAALLVVILAAGCGAKTGGTGGSGSVGEGESPIFQVEKTVGGKQVKQPIRGVEGKFGFEDAPIIAGTQDKYVWHFWNNADLPGQRMVLTAVNEATKESVDLDRVTLGPGQNGSSASSLSLMLIPKPGLWRIDVKIGDQLFGSVSVRVK